MKRALVVLTLALAGCAATPVADHAVSVRWVKVSQPNSVCRALAPRTVFFVIKGCAVWTADSCTIYARDARGVHDRDALTTLGHELKHCFDGHWHDQYGD